MKTLVIRDLAQARLLTDPFKLKLLEGFASAPATTKQVADRLGEKAPRLYRHVDALHDAGLLSLVEERPKRGTIERFYSTVAERFEIDPALFGPMGETRDEALDLVGKVFRETEAEFLAVLGANENLEVGGVELPTAARFEIRATPDELAMLKQGLDDLLAESRRLAEAKPDDTERDAYSALIAFYPAPPRDRGR